MGITLEGMYAGTMKIAFPEPGDNVRDVSVARERVTFIAPARRRITGASKGVPDGFRA